MRRLLIYCESKTEENFVVTVLAPYLAQAGICAIATGAGGVDRYAKIARDLQKLCKDSDAITTTLLDFYKMPADAPGVKTATGDCHEKARHIESKITEDFGNPDNLLINLLIHEFEGLLFSKPTAFEGVGLPSAGKREIIQLQNIKNDSRFPTPEHINDTYETVPSRRIERIISGYSKPFHGIIVAERIGIDGICAECKHFADWVAKIISMVKG